MVCPQKCIEMISDQEGFRQPVTDLSKCVDCHLCEKVCPLLQDLKDNTIITAFAAKNKDDSLRSSSSSGGIFSALAEAVLAEGGVVCAAKYDSDFSVIHDFARSSEELEHFRGAKYAQSKVEHCFSQIKKMLQEDVKVLFVGTPCQVAGLSAYLGKRHPNILMVDMICHGVPSPLVWQKYLDERKQSDAANSSLYSVNLRSKVSGWSRYSYSVEMYYKDSSHYCVPQGQDWFMRGFVSNLYLRNSCANCHFKGTERCSDLTLGDFWGIWELQPEFDDNRGTSLLWVNSYAGQCIWEQIQKQFDFISVTTDESVCYNPSAILSAVPHPKRSDFFEKVNEMEPVIPTIQNCLVAIDAPNSIFRRVLNRVKRYQNKR